MSGTDPTPQQRQTRAAREKFLQRFADDAERRAYFAALGRDALARRIVLSADEVCALGECYALLRRIAARHPKIADLEHEPTDPADGQAA
jgi:hypothetical protein